MLTAIIHDISHTEAITFTLRILYFVVPALQRDRWDAGQCWASCSRTIFKIPLQGIPCRQDDITSIREFSFMSLILKRKIADNLEIRSYGFSSAHSEIINDVLSAKRAWIFRLYVVFMALCFVRENKHHFRLPPRCQWDLSFLWDLCSVDW